MTTCVQSSGREGRPRRAPRRAQPARSTTCRSRTAYDAEQRRPRQAGDELRDHALTPEERVGVGDVEAREPFEGACTLDHLCVRLYASQRTLEIDDAARQFGLGRPQLLPAGRGPERGFSETAARVRPQPPQRSRGRAGERPRSPRLRRRAAGRPPHRPLSTRPARQRPRSRAVGAPCVARRERRARRDEHEREARARVSPA